MLALFKEVVGAIPLAEIIELPWLGCSAPITNYLLVNKHFDDAKVADKVACIGVRLGDLKRSDLRIMLSCGWGRMPQPLLQLKERHRLSGVIELRSDGGTSAVTGDVASHIRERHTGLFTEGRDHRVVEIVYSYLGEANEKEKIDEFSGLRIGQLHTLRANLFPRRDGLTDNPIYRLGESSGGLVDRNIEQANGVGRQRVTCAGHGHILLDLLQTV